MSSLRLDNQRSLPLGTINIRVAAHSGQNMKLCKSALFFVPGCIILSVIENI